MSRRRMVFIGMTVVAALGFAVDRLLLGEPSSAAAAPSPSPRPTAPSTPPPAAPSDEPGILDPSLAYLNRLDRDAAGRDVFSMTPDMMRHYRSAQEQEAEKAAQAGPRPGSPEEFLKTHTLDGTYQGPTGPLAVISGEVLRPGDIIDDFRLTRVDSFGAELRRGRDRVVLSLPQPAPASPQQGGPARKVVKTKPSR